jgi:hypothetical protein
MARTGTRSRRSDLVAQSANDPVDRRVRTRQSNNAADDRRKVNVFISYARTDSLIASALREEMVDINRERVNCFLDTHTIESGEGWERKLEDGLKAADWLVCIYTGEQSEFCGYEIGVFTGGRALRKGDGNSRLVCLHDVTNYPTVFRLHQNRFIDFPERHSSDPTFDENGFYEHSEVAKFFFDFCNYADLYVTRDQEAHKRKTGAIIHKAKRIIDAFRAARADDVLADTPHSWALKCRFPIISVSVSRAFRSMHSLKAHIRAFSCSV